MKPTSRAAPRVLMVLENNPYPQDVRVHAEALALATAGHNVSVIAPALRRAHSASQPWHETIERVRVYRYPAPASLPGAAGYLWEYGYSMVATFIISLFVLLTRGFDVLHVANPPDTFVFIAAFYKLLGKRFVYDHHDLAPEMYLARFGDGSNSLVYRVLVSLEKLSCRLA